MGVGRNDLGDPAGDLVLLADKSLVLEPDFYLRARDCVQTHGEVY
jgi:hypothetical protein